jgi:hypothetical protein
MALPVVETPTYTIKLHSVDKPIKYRPFLVKEEKILLTALEGGDTADIVSATKQIIKNCCLEEDLDTSELPSFDVEMLFLNLRARSVGEVITIGMRHPGEEPDCKGVTSVEINCNDIKLAVNEDHKDLIKLNDTVSVQLRYPDIDRMTRPEGESQMDSIFQITKACIAGIYDKDEYHDIKNSTEKELEDFIYSLDQKQFGKIVGYFNTMPKLRHKVKFNCEQCGKSESVVLEGLQSFFG